MPVRYFEWFIRGRSCLRPPNSVCVYTPIKAILHQPRTLPLARYVILSWVKSFLTLAEETVRLDWLQPTVRHGYERHAIISVVPEAFSRQYSVCHRTKKSCLGHLPRTSWTRGIWICFRACPFLGLWRALLCEEIHVRAGRGCNVFGGSMTGHQPAGELYERIVTPYLAVNSLTPRLGRF